MRAVVLDAVPAQPDALEHARERDVGAGEAEPGIEAGADHVVVDDGAIAARVRELVPDGVDATLELVGTPTLRDSVEATRVHGVVCSAG